MNEVNNKVVYFIVIYDVYLKRFHSLMTESVNWCAIQLSLQGCRT